MAAENSSILDKTLEGPFWGCLFDQSQLSLHIFVARSASIYVCQSCGAQTRQFFGRCSSCGDWNSLVEESASSTTRRSEKSLSSLPLEPIPRRSISFDSLGDQPLIRCLTGYAEFDRVLGGGLVPGSLVLLGGDPGIGKSTLLLQSASVMACNQSVLYVSAEESAQQVKMRWKRLERSKDSLHLLAETDLDLVLQELESLRPSVAIIDSIQALNDENLSSAPGSVAQVRECAAALQRVAKSRDIALLIIGHVTKEGMLAGPKVLEHLVDAVLTFEGDRFASHRLLRAVKNRYGATHELGVFEMQGNGLSEVNNPSEIFFSGQSATGVATIVACEGTRSLVVDLQALVSATSYASPRRTATGISTNRLHQILAVLEKHVGLPFARFDCYLAVAGGLDVEEPAADLGVALAVVSSYKDLILPKGTVLIGELGLGGQLRPVGQLAQRLQEAFRLGFNRAILPRDSGLSSFQNKFDLELLEVGDISEAIEVAMGK